MQVGTALATIFNRHLFPAGLFAGVEGGDAGGQVGLVGELVVENAEVLPVGAFVMAGLGGWVGQAEALLQGQ